MAGELTRPKQSAIPRRSGDDLKRLAAVDDDDAKDAAAYWREHAAEKWKELVDAEPTDTDA